MNKKILNTVTVILFSFILAVLLFSNIKTLSGAIKEIDWRNSDSSPSDQLESKIKNNIPFKSVTSNIYGLGLRAFNKKIAGNYEYFKTSYGEVMMVNNSTNFDSFYDSVVNLNQFCDNRNIPLVFVNLPFHKVTEMEAGLTNQRVYQNGLSKMCDEFRQSNINVLDLNYNDDILSLEQVFFRSDIHTTTEFEFAAANTILQYLEEQCGVDMKGNRSVLSEDNFTINQYPFYGNTTNNTGVFFSKGDTFSIYHPNFDTDMKLIRFHDGFEKAGTYDMVCLNGYEEPSYLEHTKKPYWVTNFLQWPSPCYDIINNKMSGAPNLLVICDSLFLRGTTFISLVSENVTLYDPRYDSGYWLGQAFSTHDYDAVVIIGSTIYDNPLNPPLNDYGAEIISYEQNNSFLTVTVMNSSSSKWSKDYNIRCCIKYDGQDSGIRADLPENVVIGPGESVAFVFENFAVPEGSKVSVQMLQEGVAYFGNIFELE